MSRYTNVRKRKPRCKAVMIDVISSAHRLYIETGGAQIDAAIEAANQTHEIALHRAKRYIAPEKARSRDPLPEVTKAMRELRMLLQLREKKLEQCRKDCDEAAEGDELAGKEPQPLVTERPKETPPEEFEPGGQTEAELDAVTPERQHDQNGS